jgi:hypothetical protein
MTERYTKIVLTIIAACNIVASLTGQQAAAQLQAPMHVIVDQWGPYVATMPIRVTLR